MLELEDIIFNEYQKEKDFDKERFQKFNFKLTTKRNNFLNSLSQEQIKLFNKMEVVLDEINSYNERELIKFVLDLVRQFFEPQKRDNVTVIKKRDNSNFIFD